VCNREAASVEAAAQKWAGTVDFVGVAWSGDEDSFQGFIDKYSLTFPQIADDRGDVFQRFGVLSQPAFVVIDAAGVSTTALGAVDESMLDEMLTAAST
jgi:peroxiredoxin